LKPQKQKKIVEKFFYEKVDPLEKYRLTICDQFCKASFACQEVKWRFPQKTEISRGRTLSVEKKTRNKVLKRLNRGQSGFILTDSLNFLQLEWLALDIHVLG
jgi:hypothetical protein